ncbi:hypothetical protein [Halobacillus amylolyticus]|uniref:Uncharacterized protein n=1 Tax=Halobacillus amylolyticus TaxID=2932259 RepID=A0ABY4HA20_9BACI|nr:hypothetical protein [Halobacillus amylolyticus]UOR11401.1 hypothetical protein MUO15_17670 [Halobacillus amylolyticus]
MIPIDYKLADMGVQLSKHELQTLTHEEEYWFLNEKFVQALRIVDAFYRSVLR